MTGDHPRELAELRVTFPAWRTWLSDEGRWWATRRAPLPPSRRPAGYTLTLFADTAELLREEISKQQNLSTFDGKANDIEHQ